MKRAAAILALAASAASASELARTTRLKLSAGSARAFVPKQFEPLRPGSVYPNRRRPVAARRCPVVIVETGLMNTHTREPFLERGFVVIECPDEMLATPSELIAAVGRLDEADASRLAGLFRSSLPANLAPSLRAAAILLPKIDSSRPSAIPTELLLTTPASTPSDALTARLRAAFGERCVEKWYRNEKGTLPATALRDAAEWLAIQVTSP